MPFWIVTGKETHAAKAMEIIRTYASTLKKIEGPDDPLCAGLQGFMLANAAEIMRYTYTADKYTNGWSAKDTPKVENMFRNVFQPILTPFYNGTLPNYVAESGQEGKSLNNHHSEQPEVLNAALREFLKQ